MTFLHQLQYDRQLQGIIIALLLVYTGIIPQHISHKIRYILYHPAIRVSVYATAIYFAQSNIALSLVLVLAYWSTTIFLDNTLVEKMTLLNQKMLASA